MLYQTIIIDLKCLITPRRLLIDEDIQPPKEWVEKFLKELSKLYTIKIYYKGNLNNAIIWLLNYKLTQYVADIIRTKEKCNLFLTKEKIKLMYDIDKICPISTMKV